MPKILYSVLTESVPPPSARGRGGHWLASSVGLGGKWRGGDRQRRLADGGKRLRGGTPGLLRGQERGVLVRRHRAYLKIHHRVVRAAQLGAAPHVRPLLQDRQLELVDHVAREDIALEQHVGH